jgi:Fe-S cluster assembly ATPase SufC
MSTLVVKGLRAGVEGKEILRGVDLEVSSGQVHAVMGPNGSGKSTLAHVIMGGPGYEVYEGSVTLDGVELLGLPTWERAQAGLFLAMQYPTEAVLDEIDSGLDVDALKAVSRRIELITNEVGLGVLVITHYSRLLRELRPDVISVLRKGRIVASGGPELAEELESTGYAGYEDPPAP